MLGGSGLKPPLAAGLSMPLSPSKSDARDVPNNDELEGRVATAVLVIQSASEEEAERFRPTTTPGQEDGYSASLARFRLFPGTVLMVNCPSPGMDKKWFSRAKILSFEEVTAAGLVDQAVGNAVVSVLGSEPHRLSIVPLLHENFIHCSETPYRNTLKTLKLFAGDRVTVKLSGEWQSATIVSPEELAGGADLETLLGSRTVAVRLENGQRVEVPLNQDSIKSLDLPEPRERTRSTMTTPLKPKRKFEESDEEGWVSDEGADLDFPGFKRLKTRADDEMELDSPTGDNGDSDPLETPKPVKGKQVLRFSDEEETGDKQTGPLVPAEVAGDEGVQRLQEEIERLRRANSKLQKMIEQERETHAQALRNAQKEHQLEIGQLRLENRRLQAQSDPNLLPVVATDPPSAPGSPSRAAPTTARKRKAEVVERVVRPRDEFRGLSDVVTEALKKEYGDKTPEFTRRSAIIKAARRKNYNLVNKFNANAGNYTLKDGSEVEAKTLVHKDDEEAVLKLIFDTAFTPAALEKADRQAAGEESESEAAPQPAPVNEGGPVDEPVRQLVPQESDSDIQIVGVFQRARTEDLGWSCDACTYVNPDSFLMCDICGGERPH